LNQLQDEAGVWTDPALAPVTTAGTGSTTLTP